MVLQNYPDFGGIPGTKLATRGYESLRLSGLWEVSNRRKRLKFSNSQLFGRVLLAVDAQSISIRRTCQGTGHDLRVLPIDLSSGRFPVAQSSEK